MSMAVTYSINEQTRLNSSFDVFDPTDFKELLYLTSGYLSLVAHQDLLGF